MTERQLQRASSELGEKLRREYMFDGYIAVGLSYGEVVRFVVYHEGEIPPKAPATWKGCPVEVRFTGPIRPL